MSDRDASRAFSPRRAPSARPSSGRGPRPGRRGRPDPASTSRACRLLRSWPAVAAPLRATSTNGWASTNASARASGATPSVRAAARNGSIPPRSVSRPLARASLTITPSPAAWAACRAGPAERSSRLNVAWTVSNSPTSRARSMRVGLARAGHREPDGHPAPAQSSVARRARRWSSSTPLSSVAEWIWYRPRYGPSSSRVSASWRRSVLSRQVLDLVLLGVDPPAADVGVAPLRADRERAGLRVPARRASRPGTPRRRRTSGPRRRSGRRPRRRRRGRRGPGARARRARWRHARRSRVRG